jgi:tetratricopeptide (TPR) repeat protein
MTPESDRPAQGKKTGETPVPLLERRHWFCFGLACVFIIGVFAKSAQLGILETAGSGAKDSYYNLLVQGFRAGQLNVLRAAPAGLATLANPYDVSANSSYVWYSGALCYEMSYYGGKLYLYFGATPALVLFWPWLLLTGHYFSGSYAVVVFFSIGFLVAAALIYSTWRRYFPQSPFWMVIAGMVAMGLGTGILEMLASCDVYEVAKSCGFAFTMLTLGAIWQALHEPKHKITWLLLASMAYGLAVASRSSLLFGALILLIPVLQSWKETWGRRGLLFVAATGPLALAGLALLLYNQKRFGSPWEFGWHYQLTATDQDHVSRQFSLHFLWYNIRFYFLQPLHWTGQFPYLKSVDLTPVPAGYGSIGAPFAGILTNYPVVWLALGAPLAVMKRGEASPLMWFIRALVLLSGISALTLCLFVFSGSRYLCDFLPGFMLLAVIGFFGLELALPALPAWRLIARVGCCLLLAYTVVFNILASVEVRAGTNYVIGNYFLNQKQDDKAARYFLETLSFNPKSADAYRGLGAVFFAQNQADKASVFFQKALEIKPDFEEAHYDLGSCYLRMGRGDDALAEFRRALELGSSSSDIYERYGDALFQLGKLPDAMIQYGKAVEIKPDFPEAHNNLGYCLMKTGHTEEAIAQYQMAVTQQPGFAQAYNNLGDALRAKGLAADAVAAYQKAIAQDAQLVAPRRNLAWMRATWPEASVRNGAQAVVLAEQANQLSNGADPKTLQTLGAAYAEAGHFSEAIATSRKALALATSQGNTALANELQTEMGLYQKNMPYHAAAY